jgi:CobQ-like glutamine amidotransferase family enzyme
VTGSTPAPAAPAGTAPPPAGTAPRPPLSIALVYPDILGTYGDAGNATVLAQRLRWRGVETEILTVGAGEALPDSCEMYVVGGGEDLPQWLAAARLRESRALHRAVAKGAVVLAICAGLQILGERFAGPDDEEHQGLGLLPCVTHPGRGPRAIGEVIVRPTERWSSLGLLTGFENHAAVTDLLPGAEPAGKALTGVGNKDGTAEGVVAGRIWGTYLHGPVLARNPKLADLLLSWVVGDLAPLDDSEPEALHAQRVSRGPSERRPAGRSAWYRRARLRRAT